MKMNSDLVKKVVGNRLILYIFSRYGIYFIQFLNSLFIAVYLGPYYLGIWGFISLILNYITQIDFGISHSVNAIISINKNEEMYVKNIIGTAMTMLLGISFLVGAFFFLNWFFNFGFGNKYNFSTYAPVVCLTGIVGYYNALMARVFRVFGRVMEMAFNQSIFPILMLVAIFTFKGEFLLWALVIANLIAFGMSLGLYLWRAPLKLRFHFSKDLWKIIQVKGWHLFVYNTSFYLIIISTRTFVSGYYMVEDFGYFTFAFALANAFLLFLQSISSLIFPKVLNRMANSGIEKSKELIELMRNSYISVAHFLIHIAIAVVPVFILLIPQYLKSGEAFHLIALTVVLYTNSYGYSGLLIAKGKEKRLGYLSFLAFVINIMAVLLLVTIYKVPFTYVILGTMFSYFVYVFMVGRMGRNEMKLDCGILQVIKDIFPLRMALPFLMSLLLFLFSSSTVLLLTPLVLFLILNFKALIGLKPLVKSMVFNSRVIDI